MDLRDYYYVAGKYMECRVCSGTFISWDRRILDQLTSGVPARFPVLMTRKYACDQSVIALLHSHTLGIAQLLSATLCMKSTARSD